jgi:hypothetical protein
VPHRLELAVLLAGWKPMNSAGEWSSRAVRYSLDRGPRFVGHLHDALGSASSVIPN